MSLPEIFEILPVVGELMTVANSFHFNWKHSKDEDVRYSPTKYDGPLFWWKFPDDENLPDGAGGQSRYTIDQNAELHFRAPILKYDVSPENVPYEAELVKVKCIEDILAMYDQSGIESDQLCGAGIEQLEYLNYSSDPIEIEDKYSTNKCVAYFRIQYQQVRRR